VGDFLKVCRAPGFEPAKTAFLMPTAEGPCRFGQYAPYLRQLMDQLGYADVVVFSPNSKDGYKGMGVNTRQLIATMWMVVIAGDIALRFLLKTRPYETCAGDSDEAFQRAVRDFEAILERPDLSVHSRLRELTNTVCLVRNRFRSIPATYERGRPLIGLVGEIFCRHNTFSNDDVTRRIERLGGECWLSDIAEWVWYVNWYVQNKIEREHGRFNLQMLKHLLKVHVQHKYEKALLEPVERDLVGYEEPHDVREVLDAAGPYLPAQGSVGEMVLSVGKTIYLYRKGADGIIDISPFTCMNGLVCEAVYPSVSKDHEDLPIRILYFDGVNTNIDRDLEIFLDLARAYQKRKTRQRAYPAYFD